jgi:hypothetical protein
MILVLLFHDFLQPITILGALPLSIGGAFVALLMTGMSFSMPSLIGLLMLMGVVTKNSILLVEYAITARRQGLERNTALIDACHKRARPIVMTTIAMTAGALFFDYMYRRHAPAPSSTGANATPVGVPAHDPGTAPSDATPARSMAHALWVETREPICAGLVAGAALVGILDVLVRVFLLG